MGFLVCPISSPLDEFVRFSLSYSFSISACCECVCVCMLPADCVNLEWRVELVHRDGGERIICDDLRLRTFGTRPGQPLEHLSGAATSC